ncbi:pyridoxamine 5'-phosphate oxidase family protein [Halorarius halobius]|uniref:pyridoxamine 5'-phosphate oxidase family protein n=1 Tax=Halorarius halobius TaxID=2962671 RepID=UPI0020CCF5A2|nr:pyridoxamine 5'-phosphate oxidase family protein [Halorarius halobius]
MDETSPVALDGDAITEFLGTGGTGVISLSAGDDPPVSRPVSYGFDAETRSFYFRLAAPADSEKAGRLDGPASFVVYGETVDGWRSVVATGSLAPVGEETVDTELLEGLRRVHIPLFDVFDHDTRDVPFQFVRLDPDSLTGLAETDAPE